MTKQTFDVVIAGAGIIGSSLAWRLAQKGLRILLADAGPLGGEASTAGAGMLAPGGEISEESEFASLLIRSLRLYSSFVAELEEASGSAIDFSTCGAIEHVSSDAEVASFRTRTTAQGRLGIACEQISPTEFFYPDDGWVNPVDVISALRIALAGHRDVTIREHKTIREIEPARAGVIVDGVHARIAVIAAGAWSSHVQIPGITLPAAYPVKGHLLGYQLPAGSIARIHRGGHSYVLQRSNGFTVVGASQEDAGFDKAVDVKIAARVRNGGEALLPILRQYDPVSVWTGLRPGADRPLFHRLQDTNVWLAYGHFRNGILSAPATAERLAGEITAALSSISETDSSARGRNP